MTVHNKKIILNIFSQIYFGQAVCSSEEVRGSGLGGELVIRSNEIAVESGCEYSYLVATGIFSQSLFAKVGYQVLKEVKYEDILDKRGRKIVWDHREHSTTQVMFLKL